MRLLIRPLVWILMTTVLLSSCSNDYTLDIYGTIEGRVTDSSSGDPVEAAQVTLVPSSRTSQTTEDGSFSFSGLDEGQYTISVQKAGYQANRKSVTVTSGECSSIVVLLTGIPKN